MRRRPRRSCGARLESALDALKALAERLERGEARDRHDHPLTTARSFRNARTLLRRLRPEDGALTPRRG